MRADPAEQKGPMTTAITTTNEPNSAAAQVIITGPTLKELAATANHEHHQVLAAAGTMVQHAIKVGEALQAARKQLKHGDWLPWLEQNFEGHSPGTAQTYMRIALYQEHLPSHVDSINQAEAYLRRLPASPQGGGRAPHSDAVRDEALRLRDSGLSQKAIAEMLGIHHSTLSGWFNPESVRAQIQKRSAARALRRQEREERRRTKRDEAARKAGGSVAEGYSLIRKALQALDRAHGDQTDREVRVALGAATAKLHGAEDEIVRALGVE